MIRKWDSGAPALEMNTHNLKKKLKKKEAYIHKTKLLWDIQTDQDTYYQYLNRPLFDLSQVLAVGNEFSK